MIGRTGSNPDFLTSENSRALLCRRAEALSIIRQHFAEQLVIEVETPLLGRYPVSDPYLDNLKTAKPFASEEWLYLQTSPEYAMKCLLAKGSGSIYQICKAFRQDPIGDLHAIEFTMIEWYREGFDLSGLMDDVAQLVAKVVGNRPIEILSYRNAFKEYVGIDPFSISSQALRDTAKSVVDTNFEDACDDVWLDLLLTHKVEPNLGKNVFTFLCDYPPEQAALAKLKKDDLGEMVAARFELYINGVEIANGYDELTDADVFLQRFKQDNNKRKAMGKSEVALDEAFYKAMLTGLPDCAGVALGLDRLLLSLNYDQ